MYAGGLENYGDKREKGNVIIRRSGRTFVRNTGNGIVSFCNRVHSQILVNAIAFNIFNELSGGRNNTLSRKHTVKRSSRSHDYTAFNFLGQSSIFKPGTFRKSLMFLDIRVKLCAKQLAAIQLSWMPIIFFFFNISE